MFVCVFIYVLHINPDFRLLEFDFCQIKLGQNYEALQLTGKISLSWTPTQACF